MMKHQSWITIIHLLSQLVVYDSYNFDEFLKKLIKLILQVIPFDSCLIYFLDRSEHELTLIASKKPHAKLIGKIKLKKGEGITGWVAEHQEPVVIKKLAYKDIRFKSFKEVPEDRYEAFMSVPITDKFGCIGVINLQHKLPYSFEKEQIEMLEAIVKIISSAFENIVLQKKVGILEQELNERKAIERAKGVLMKKDGMSEQEAYALIRHEAMKKRKTKKEIAEAILLVWG